MREGGLKILDNFTYVGARTNINRPNWTFEQLSLLSKQYGQLTILLLNVYYSAGPFYRIGRLPLYKSKVQTIV